LLAHAQKCDQKQIVTVFLHLISLFPTRLNIFFAVKTLLGFSRRSRIHTSHRRVIVAEKPALAGPGGRGKTHVKQWNKFIGSYWQAR
jgi:hypothetical protein